MNQTQSKHQLTATLLAQLRAVEAVARHGSFTDAAGELFVGPSALSHHVKRLERHLGVTLLDRRRDRTVATPDAIDLIDTCRTAFASLGNALARLDRNRSDVNAVTVTVAPFFSTHWLTPRLARFWRLHPEIDLRLHHAYEPVDFDRDDVDLGLAWGTGNWNAASSTKILDGSLVAVCNPAVRATLGDLTDLRPLLDETTLLYEFEETHWHQWLEPLGTEPTAQSRLTQIDDSHALRSAALNGYGVALFPRSLLVEEIAQGSLVELAPHRVGNDHYYLVVPTGRPTSNAVDEFVNWIHAELASLPSTRANHAS